jgi:lysophospholipase L1-like esterase
MSPPMLRWQIQIILMTLLGFGGSALSRAQLVLTNFSPANPIKVLCVGDSITDDCYVSGAWRRPLQPLLSANNFPYTTLGRVTSPAVAGFTEREHEGYCGAVIAAPGQGGTVNGYPGAQLYLQKILADALTNATPDVVLLLIGANDIGRGRNPRFVATNDLANLVAMIFSNVPNASVLLAKITTLQDALGSTSYGAYATNVPIYNAALQAWVNQRRALGQKLFLADMFSVVDYSTMFMSDHLHPNALGVAAIAQEWATRLQTISVTTNQVTTILLPGGAVWKYADTGVDLGSAWTQPGYDDSAWSSGPARLGYGDPAVATTVSFGASATNKHRVTYFRREFVVPENVAVTNLEFRVARADGVAIHLNGQELFRTNLPAGSLSFTNLALTRMTGFTPHIFYPTNLAVPVLPAGTNLVTAAVHLSSPTNASLGFDLELIGRGYYLVPPPQLAITPIGNSVRLEWAAAAADYTLYTTTNLSAGVGWGLAPALRFTNGGQIVVTQAVLPGATFFRLQKP